MNPAKNPSKQHMFIQEEDSASKYTSKESTKIHIMPILVGWTEPDTQFEVLV